MRMALIVKQFDSVAVPTAEILGQKLVGKLDSRVGACFGQKRIGGLLYFGEVIFVHLHIGTQHGKIKLLHTKVVLPPNFHDRADKRAQLSRGVGQQFEQVGRFNTKHTQGQVAENIGAEEFINWLHFFAQLHRY